MMNPFPLDLRANRWTPFVEQLTVQNVDLTGATFALEIRTEFDVTGAAIATLANAAAGSQGVSVAVDTDGAEDISAITIRVNEATNEALPAAGEVGDDLDLYYDLHVTRSGSAKEVWFRGKYIVVAGATH